MGLGDRYAQWLCRFGTVAAALCLTISPAHTAQPTAYNIVVAQDGSGDFTTVQAAIDAAARRRPNQRVIYIKTGVYEEKVAEPTNNVVLVGEDANRTIITCDDYVYSPDEYGEPLGTDQSATFWVYGADVTMYNLTIENASDSGLQAVALWAQGDRDRFFGCRFLGYQDTLYASHRTQYFKNCYITGSVDFIFGAATAVFDHCTIDCQSDGYVTAASTPEKKQFGFVFRNCMIKGDAEARSVYLGRPWRAGAAVAFIHCMISDVINPAGWDNFEYLGLIGAGDFAEYGNTGAGADLSRRVNWTLKLSAAEAAEFTLKNIYKVPPGATDAAALWYKDN